MANTANATYNTSGPGFSFQQLAFGGRDMQELAYRGSVTFTGDNATSTLTINWIDGTQTPFFTPGNPPTAVAPKLVMAQVTTGAVSGTNITGISSITTTGCVVQFSGNVPASAFTVAFVVYPY